MAKSDEPRGNGSLVNRERSSAGGFLDAAGSSAGSDAVRLDVTRVVFSDLEKSGRKIFPMGMFLANMTRTEK